MGKENKEFNTLSLFNGFGCVWQALELAGINPTTKYSSEIEKYPNQANDLLYPETIQLGDVRDVDVSKLKPIHFLAGGSPCQSFSFAGKRKGMSGKKEEIFKEPSDKEYLEYLKTAEFEIDFEDYVENQRLIHKKKNTVTIEILTLEHYLQLKKESFEFEGQSYLFWEYIRILTDIKKYNPEVIFLLENVIMGSKWQKILTRAIGINPIKINAALVSAQNRDRLFWTNINTEQYGLFGDLKCMIPQPKDEGILLKDVLEKPEDFKSKKEYNNYMKKYFLSEKMIKYLNSRKANFNNGKINYKSENDVASCLNASIGLDISDNIIVEPNRKAKCFTAGGNSGGLHSQMELIVHNTMPRSSKTGKGGTGTLSRTGGKTYCLDTGNTNAIEIFGCDFRIDEGIRVRQNGKSGTLQARARNDESCGQLAMVNKTIRRLTPRETGRLQTVPEDKLQSLLDSGIKDTHLYKMFGNGWCVKVVAHIFKYLKHPNLA